MDRWVFLAAGASLLLSTVWVGAEQVLVLKNGREIAVQSYREENGMITFFSFGGEVRISKDQVLSIRAGATPQSKGAADAAPPPAAPAREAAKETVPAQPAPAPKLPSLEEEKAQEAKEYQRRLTEISERLKESQERYSQAIRGTTSANPTLLTSEEQLKARADDIISRALDAQYNPSGSAGAKVVTPSPFTSLPPTVTEVAPSAPAAPRSTADLPAYTERQKYFSDLRSQILQLENERNALIEEIKQKNIPGAELLQ